MVISCTGHLRKNTLAIFKQHPEKAVDYIGVFIANLKILRFLDINDPENIFDMHDIYFK